MKDKLKWKNYSRLKKAKETWQLSDPGLDLGSGKTIAIRGILGTIDEN